MKPLVYHLSPWRAALSLVLLLTTLSGEYVHGEAVAIGTGSSISPDHRFAFQLSPSKHGYDAEIRDRRSGKSISSVLANPVEEFLSVEQDEESLQPFDFQTAIYRVDWTGDSKCFAVIYHIADGSAVSVFRFDGKVWHRIEPEPSPVYPKCPYDDETEQYGNSPPMHFHEPSLIGTIFDEKASLHTIWLSYGIQTDQSHRHSHFYVCNFDFDPVSQKLSHVELRALTIPEFLKLRARRDYSRSAYPRL